MGRTVDRYCLVRLDGARYSVEPGHVGAEVSVVTRPGDEVVEIRRGARVIGQHSRTATARSASTPPTAPRSRRSPWPRSAGLAGTGASPGDARIGPKAAEEAAIVRARAALGDAGTVQPVDLARYDQLWRQP